jgi:hypothetical protein
MYESGNKIKIKNKKKANKNIEGKSNESGKN